MVQEENKVSKVRQDLPEIKEKKVHRVTLDNLERTVPKYGSSFKTVLMKIASIIYINFLYDFFSGRIW